MFETYEDNEGKWIVSFITKTQNGDVRLDTVFDSETEAREFELEETLRFKA